ncbi:MAG: DEAD/DEAH box helicase [Planctomycetota bacterium]|jgi:ATP-dependent RNA helicase RhlE
MRATVENALSFADLGLRPELLAAIADQGYTTPTPIQERAIPAVLAGRDVLGGAQTGTGKTAAFTLPVLQLLTARDVGKQRQPRVLVLTPTRELAAQVGESVATYGGHLPLRSAVIFGGVGINPQIDRLRRGVDILVATPGRLLDHAGQRTVDLSHIEILILDEADRMLDMGFIHDILKVLKLLPNQRQNLLFSATYSDEIRELAGGILKNPVEVEVARRNTAAETVAQVAHPVTRSAKNKLLTQLIKDGKWQQVLVFTRTKHSADRVARHLTKSRIEAAAIHGNKSQGARTRALAGFKDGSVRVLVATDIAARGLDIDGLPYVVQYDLPNVAEDYVHRIGRTGRAGASGCAVSLVSSCQNKLMAAIERVIGRRVPVVEVEGFIQDPRDIDTAPVPGRGGGQRGGGQRGGQQENSSRRDPGHQRPAQGGAGRRRRGGPRR